MKANAQVKSNPKHASQNYVVYALLFNPLVEKSHSYSFQLKEAEHILKSM